MSTALTVTTHSALRPTTMLELLKLAEGFVVSKLFGFNTVDQAMMMMLVCEAEGRHPVEAGRRYHIINGKPSIKAEALLADYRKAGGRVRWIKREDSCVEAVFVNPDQDESPVIRWDDARVKRAFLEGNHLKFPCQMKTARVISEGVGLMMPELKQGISTQEEIMDMEPTPSGQFVATAAALEPTQSRMAPVVTTPERVEAATAPASVVSAPERVEAATPPAPVVSAPAAVVSPVVYDFKNAGDLKDQITAALQNGHLDTIAGLLDATAAKCAAKPDKAPNMAKAWSVFAPSIHESHPGLTERLTLIGCPKPAPAPVAPPVVDAEFEDQSTPDDAPPFILFAPISVPPVVTAPARTPMEAVEDFGRQLMASKDKDAAYFFRLLITEHRDLPPIARQRWDAIRRGLAK